MNKNRIGALIAAAALTLTFAGTALATTTYNWQGNGYPNAKCDESSTVMQWVWTGDSPSSLTINGQVQQSDTWTQKGGGAWQYQADINGTNYPPTLTGTSIEYTGDAGTLTLSGCDEHTTTTTSEETTETTTETTTSQETTVETTTSQETTTTSQETTTTTPTGTLFAVPAFTKECGGSITVSNFAAANVEDVLITPGDVVINGDGTTPLAPGEYVAVGRVGGEIVTDEVAFTIEACPTTTTAEETTPGGSVEELTPPSTDTIGASTAPSSVPTSLLLVFAGLLASALVVIPAAARKRR